MANNAIDLVASQEALKGLNELIIRLDVADKALIKAADDALKLNSNLNQINTPSGLTNNSNNNAQVTAQLKAQQTQIELLEKSIVRLTAVKKQKAQTDAQEAVNQRILNQNALNEAKSTSNLVGAYQKLDLAHKKAMKSAQDIGAQYGSTSKQFLTASVQANKLDKELKQIDSTLGKSNRNVGNYRSAFNGLGSALSQLGFIGGVAGAVALGQNIFETTKEIISLDNALKLVTGTAENFAEQQAFLAKISEDFGVDINGLTKQFTQFYVSAKDKLAGNEIQDIFRSVTKAGASMGLSVQNQERAFLALNQMMSKGTIQAEELRGQLGEALPGAFGIMAKAVGVNEAELAKMMKSGQLLADEVLPKFARQLEITYGIDKINSIDNLTSAQNRLSNAWTNFVRSLNNGDGVVSKFFQTIIEGATGAINSLTNLNKSLADIRGELNSNAKESTKEYLNTIKDVDEREQHAILTKKDAIKNITEYNEKLAQANHAYELYNKVSVLNFTPSRMKARKEASKQIEEMNANLGTQKGRLLAAQQVLDEINKKETKSITIKKDLGKIQDKPNKEKTKQKDKELTQYEKELLLLKELEDNVKKLDQVQKDIDDAKLIRQEIDKNQQLAEFDLIEKKILQLEELKKATQNWLKSFSTEFLQNSGFGSLETFFDGTFDKLLEGAETTQEKFAVTFNAIAESAQEAFNFISNISQQKFAEETARAESQYDIALGFANGNAEAEAKLAEDLANRKKDIANRENKVKQKQAIFNIAIDTAQAIVSSLKTDPTGILALIIGALGAVQIGVVSSQQIPQYFDGGVHDGGLAMINDAGGSNYVETVVTPDGKAKQYKGRDVVTNLPKGTEIFTPEQWHEKQLFDMLQNNNVSMPIINQKNNGITAQDVDRVIGKHFSKIQVNNTTFDVNGMRTWSENNGNKTIRDAKRVSRSGFNV